MPIADLLDQIIGASQPTARPPTKAGNRTADLLDRIIGTAPPELRAAPGARGVYPEPEVKELGVVGKFGPPAARMGGVILGNIAGGVAAIRTGQPAAYYALGAAGAGAGETLAQGIEKFTGQREQWSPVEAGAATIVGGILPRGAGTVGETAAKQALTNLAITQATAGARKLAEPEKPYQAPSGIENLLSLLLGYGGGMIGGARPVQGEPQTRINLQGKGIPEPMGPPHPPPEPPPPSILDLAAQSQRLPKPIAPETTTSSLLRQAQETMTKAPGQPGFLRPPLPPREGPAPTPLFPPEASAPVSPEALPPPLPQPAPDLIPEQAGPPPQPGFLRRAEDLIREPYEPPVTPPPPTPELVEPPFVPERVPPPEPLQPGQGFYLGAPREPNLEDILIKGRPAPDLRERLQAASQKVLDLKQKERFGKASQQEVMSAQQEQRALQKQFDEAIAGEETRGFTIGEQPRTIGQILRSQRGSTRKPFVAPEREATPLEIMAKEFGDDARKVQHLVQQNEFADAHRLADEAWTRFDEVAQEWAKKNPGDRISQIVAKTLRPPEEAAAHIAQVSGYGRGLQRYSAIVQALEKEAAKDPAAAAFLKVLKGEPMGQFKQAMQFWRGQLTGTVMGAIRDASDQSASYLTNISNQAMTGIWEDIITGGKSVITGEPMPRGAFEGTKRGIQGAIEMGQISNRRAIKGLTEALRIAQKNPDELEKLFAAHPDIEQLLMTKPEGLEGKLGKWTEFWNKPRQVQEMFWRPVFFEGELRARLGDKADYFINVRPDLIPTELLTKSAERALSGTFQGLSRWSMAQDIVHLFAKHPALHAIAPFPNYIAKRMEYVVDHNPAAFFRLITTGRAKGKIEGEIALQQKYINMVKAGEPLPGKLGQIVSPAEAITKLEQNIQNLQGRRGTIDTPAEVMGKATTGLLFTTAVGVLRDVSNNEGPWYLYDLPGGYKFDVRPFGTLAQFSFFGELARQIYNNRVHGTPFTMTSDEIQQGLFILGTRSGVGLTLSDWWFGRKNLSPDNIWKAVSEGAADLAGTFGAGLFRPLSQLKNVAAAAEGAAGVNLTEQGIPTSAQQYNYQGTAFDRLWKPSAANIPYLPQLLGMDPRYSPTSALVKHNVAPIWSFFGAPMSKPTAVESAVARAGTSSRSLYPKGDPRLVNEILKRSGGAFERRMTPRVESERWKRLSPGRQKQMLQEGLTESRAFGRRHLPIEMRREEREKRREERRQRR